MTPIRATHSMEPYSQISPPQITLPPPCNAPTLTPDKIGTLIQSVKKTTASPNDPRPVIQALLLRDPSPHTQQLQPFLAAYNAALLASNPETIGDTLFDLGTECNAIGKHPQAFICFQKLLDTAPTLELKGAAYNGLGLSLFHQKDYSQALDYHRKHLDIALLSGDLESQSCAYTNMGFAYYQLGKYRQAIPCFANDLTISKRLHDLHSQQTACLSIAQIYKALGDPLLATYYQQQAFEISLRITASHS